MPTYEYACRDCGEHLEVVQSFKDDALTECPNCHGQLRKVFSAAGIIFKGSGWHIKDYSSKSGSATGGSSADASGTAKESSSGTAKEASSAEKKASSDTGSGGSSSTPAEKSA